MKKVVLINTYAIGSTGKIMSSIADSDLKKDEYEFYCFYGIGKCDKNGKYIKIGNKITVHLHKLLADFGFNGYGSVIDTIKLVIKLKKINPDIIHLHNIHGYYLNFNIFFKYLKNDFKGKIVWSFHDCWPFTGHCSHFTYVKCNKWETGCYSCPQLRYYPIEYIDTTKHEYKMKKNLFSNLKNVDIIVPSNWLYSMVKKSFFKDYNISIINNGINFDIFKPEYDENIYLKYGIPRDKKIILGVSYGWNQRKGLDIFIELSKRILKNECIVLVGVDDLLKQQLPENIIGISRTDNQNELAQLYSIADLFLNPSYEETFSLVTLEAMACGVGVIVSCTTAIKELVTDEVGLVVKENTIEQYYNCYKKFFKTKYDKKKIINHAHKYNEKFMVDKTYSIYGGEL